MRCLPQRTRSSLEDVEAPVSRKPPKVSPTIPEIPRVSQQAASNRDRQEGHPPCDRPGARSDCDRRAGGLDPIKYTSLSLNSIELSSLLHRSRFPRATLLTRTCRHWDDVSNGFQYLSGRCLHTQREALRRLHGLLANRPGVLRHQAYLQSGR